MRRVHASFDRGVVGGVVWRPSIALLCALAAFALATIERDAHASCGDYVTVSGAMAGEAHHRPMSQTSTGSRPVPVCSGPHCQRQYPLPPLPKPLMRIAVPESACVFVGRLPDAAGGETLVVEPIAQSSQAVLNPPDRPPRDSL